MGIHRLYMVLLGSLRFIWGSLGVDGLSGVETMVFGLFTESIAMKKGEKLCCVFRVSLVTKKLQPTVTAPCLLIDFNPHFGSLNSHIGGPS